MAADTLIKEDFRIRKVAGGLFVFLGVPLTLISVRFGLSVVDSFGGLLIVAIGPLMILVGFWAAFPQRKPKVRLRITDDRIEMTDLKGEAQVIALHDLLQISVHRPLSGKHGRVTMVGKEIELKLDIVQLTHEAQDIIKLISIRLEGQGRYLEEGRTEVLGARSGVWKVLEGAPF